MNSSQRRRQKREHKYTVVINSESYSRFIDFDNAAESARKWCKKKCVGAWHLRDDWNTATFMFALERDAVFFALKWL